MNLLDRKSLEKEIDKVVNTYGEKADLLDDLNKFKEQSFLLCCYLSEYSKQKCNGGQK